MFLVHCLMKLVYMFQYLPPMPGDFIDVETGNVVGKHKGTIHSFIVASTAKDYECLIFKLLSLSGHIVSSQSVS